MAMNRRTMRPQIDEFSPSQLRPDFWLSSNYRPNYTTINGADFRGDGHRLRCDAHADFDFSVVKKFSVEFWKNTNTAEIGGSGLDRTYIGQTDANTGQCWVIASGDGAATANGVKCIFSPNGNASGQWGKRYAPASGRGVSHYVATFDFTGGTPLIKVYLDKVDTAEVSSFGTPSTTIPSSASDVTLGCHGNDYWNGNHIQNRTRGWKDRVLTQSDVNELNNNGLGMLHSELSAGLLTNLVASWDLTEAAGQTRVDSTGRGHDLTEAGGTVLSTPVIRGNVTELSVNHLAMHGLDYMPNSTTFDDQHFNGAFTINPTAIDNKPAFVIKASKGMYVGGLTNPLPSHVNDCFMVVKWSTLPADGVGGEDFIFSKTDISGFDSYYIWGAAYNPTLNRFAAWMRISNDPDNFDAGNWGRTTGLQNNTWYIINWRSLGAGDADSWECRINGVQQTIEHNPVTPFDYNMGPGKVTPSNALMINGIALSNGSQFGAHREISDIWTKNGGLTVAENRMVEQWFADRYGITLG